MSDYNIHIHLPGDQNADGEPVQEAPQNKLDNWFKGFVEKVKHCYDWKSFYELSEDFNQIGLALQDTAGSRKVLCRLEQGVPTIGKIVDDYIFVGSAEQLDEEISQRALEVIVYFIESKASQPQLVVDANQKYSKETALYGEPLQIYAESNSISRQEVEVLSRMIGYEPYDGHE